MVSLLLVAVMVLPACSAPEDGAQTPGAAVPDAEPPAAENTDQYPGGLAGTTWQFVEFQSMDDAQGVTRVDDPSRFVMELMADGTVAMQLDCNRATGTWSAGPGADGSSGTFEFGLLAMTRALCPPPNLDEKIARDSEYIRGYLLRDGRLYLSLMADAGIYVWEPTP